MSRLYFPNTGFPGDWDFGQSGGFRIHDIYAKGALYLEGTASGAPTFTTRSAGTKFVAYSNMSGSTVDYGMGVEPSNLWFSTAAPTTGFKLYGGTAMMAQLQQGVFEVLTAGGSSGANLKLTGDGATTPMKFIRAKAGNLEFVNSAYANVIATLSDTGALTLPDKLTVASSVGSGGTVQLTDTGAAGINLKLTGNGTAPNTKYLRVLSGAFEVINHAYSSVLFSLNDAGVLSMLGASASIELGAQSTATTPAIDFHSSGNNIDYDSRLIANGGSGTVGQGTLSYYGAYFQFNSILGIVNANGANGALQITDTTGNGVNIRMTGNGATTPNKYVRVQSGSWQVVNNAYSAVILSLDDSGNLWSGAQFTAGVGLANQLAINGCVAGGTASISASGASTNIGISINAKSSVIGLNNAVVATDGSNFFTSTTTNEGQVGANFSGQNPVYLFNNGTNWGMYSASGGRAFDYTRSSGLFQFYGNASTVTNGAYVSALNTFTRGQTIDVSVANDTVLIAKNTSSNGVQFSLQGNGAVTPNKTIRCLSGVLDIVNSAYTLAILALTDAGTLSVSDVVYGNSHGVLDAYLSSSQSITTGTWTKLTNMSAVADNKSWFASAKWTVQRAGYYLLSAQVGWVLPGSSCIGGGAIYVNGAVKAQGISSDASLGSYYFGSVPAKVVFLNVGDYVELYGYQSSGSSVSPQVDASMTYISATYLRP